MDETVFNENNCVICLGEFSSYTEKATVVKAGVANLLKYSKQRCDVSLQVHLETQNKTNPACKVLVYARCRPEYLIQNERNVHYPKVLVICMHVFLPYL